MGFALMYNGENGQNAQIVLQSKGHLCMKDQAKKEQVL